MVDLLHVHDPRKGELDHILLGVGLKESRRQDLRFLPTKEMRCLGPALIYAFERLGGLPRMVRLPLILPFCRMVDDGPPALHPELDGLAHAFQVLFVFPALHELPGPWWGLSLEISCRRVVKEFLPGRFPESLSARNRALDAWLRERRPGSHSQLSTQHRGTRGRRT